MLLARCFFLGACAWMSAADVGHAQSRADTLVSLDEAVALALSASPTLARGVGTLREARATERTATAAYLPTLALESNTLRASTPSPVSQPGLSGIVDGSSAAGLTSTVDLFTGGRRGAERRRASAVSAATEASLVERRFAVILETKRIYYEVLRDAELARVAQTRVERAQEGLDAARRRHEVGTATKSDELRAQLELSDARLALLGAQAARRAAMWALGRAVGRDGAIGAAPVDSIGPHPLALDEAALLALATRQSPGVRAAEATTRATGASVGAARTRYMPTVQAAGGYRWLNEPNATLFGSHALWDLRVGLALPIFDGLQREEAITRARAENDVAGADLADRRRGARAETERVLAALGLAEQRIVLSEEAVRVAQEDLRVQQARYRVGAASILDRITSQVNLATAETNLVAARYDYQLSRAELEAIVGRPL